MSKNKDIKMLFLTGVLVVVFILVVMAMTPHKTLALAPVPTPTEFPEGCKLTENCTANDFGTFIVNPADVHVNVPECVDVTGPGGIPDGIKEVNLDFSVVYPSNQPTRYDIGSIMANDGLDPLRDISLLPGLCTRDYLPPPLTTTTTATGEWPDALGQFWNGEPGVTADICGDLPPSNSAKRYYNDIWVACVDRDNNGQIDISICLYYDNNAQDTCTSLMDATTGTTAKCQCQTVNLPVTPTAITLESLDVSSALPVGYVIGIAVLLSILLLVGLWLTWQMKKRAEQK